MIFDWQIFVSSFFIIFLAELGDKTQISTFAFASKSKAPLSVFLGASSALILTTVIAVVLGGVIGRIVPEKIIKGVAGTVFIVFGVITLLEVLRR
jgi:putative Ca2+/H+ antiporter (TMEM165/GDT1 family)